MNRIYSTCKWACMATSKDKYYTGIYKNLTDYNVEQHTGSIPRYSLHSHSLVCMKSNSWFLVIEPQNKNYFIKLCFWWYAFISCTQRWGRVLQDKYTIYINIEVFIISPFFSTNTTSSPRASSPVQCYIFTGSGYFLFFYE